MCERCYWQLDPRGLVLRSKSWFQRQRHSDRSLSRYSCSRVARTRENERASLSGLKRRRGRSARVPPTAQGQCGRSPSGQRGHGRFSRDPSCRTNLLFSNHLVKRLLPSWLASVVTLLSPFAVLVARTVLRSSAVGRNLRDLMLLLLNHRLTHFHTQLACMTYLYTANVTLQTWSSIHRFASEI